MSVLYQMLSTRFSPPKPSHKSYEGQTVLVTAATGGIGLEAAKKLAAQGTSTLIITARDEKKGAIAKAAIEAHLRSLSKKPTNIIALTLELSDPASIHSFAAALKQHATHLDHAILNAGVMQTTHSLSSSNYETTIQINTISTVLLSLPILPFLLASPLTNQPSVAARPHLSFVSSGIAWIATLDDLRQHADSTDAPMTALSKQSAFPAGMMAASIQYGRSKLLLEYCIRQIAYLPALLSDPSDPTSEPKVLVTSVCPGACRSDIGRNIFGSSWIVKVMKNMVYPLIAKTAEAGANSYITSLEVGSEGRGEQWKEDRLFIKESEVNVKSEEGRKLGEKVWSEMSDIVLREDGAGIVRGLLGEEKTGK